MEAPESQTAILRAFVGKTLGGRYRLDALLAAGGMGAVFRAHHLALGRDVAVKMLHPELTADPLAIKRFEREAQSTSQIEHGNCVRVSDFSRTNEGIVYLVMELIEGEPLSKRLGRPLPPAKAVDMISQILEGLDAAHHRGVVHRDLKPENILVSTDHRGHEVLKIVDFGIAKLLEDGTTRTRLTKTGFVFGTPRYLSPEQALGEAITERTDLYAVGILLYEMLAGRSPFHATSPHGWVEAHVTHRPRPLPGSVPHPLMSMAERLLAKRPAHRFKSAREVLDALARLRPELEGLPAAPAGTAAPADDDGPATRALDDRDVTVASDDRADATGVATKIVPPPAPPSSTPPTPAAHRSTGAIAIVGGLTVLGVAVGVVLATGGEPPSAFSAAHPPPSTTVDPRPKAPTPRPSPPPLAPLTDPAEATRVQVVIAANVDASILDGDGRVLGTANAGGFTLPRDDEPVTLHLRHEGFEELAMEFTPNADLTLVRSLQPVETAGAKQPGRRPGSYQSASAPPPTNTAEKPTRDDDFMPLEKVRDPFEE